MDFVALMIIWTVSGFLCGWGARGVWESIND